MGTYAGGGIGHACDGYGIEVGYIAVPSIIIPAAALGHPASLLDSIGNLEVGGWFCLQSRDLTSLPESFSSMRVGGEL